MKRLLLILTMVCLASSGWAEKISREQALQKARQFMSQKGKHGTLTAAETAMTKARRRSMQQVPDYYYVFNAGQDQGYVVVSGDDRMAPILGYANHGTFDVDKIPCNMAAWLEGYAEQIKYVQEHPEAVVTRGDVPTHADVGALISTTWGQNAPYNNLLPTYNGQRCVTGCGATAMAQIMNYHGAPSSCPDIPAYTTSTHGIACEALPATTFNWGNMGSDDEVAKLMKYCAYALQADLDPGGTSAFDNMIVTALTGYFGYGSGVQEAYHSTYGEADWDMLIYNEIANSRPVILIGQSPSAGGHFFILHGYSVSGGVGYYTVNWGWDGFEDGNFLLSAMDPKSIGSGFNDNQAVIVGISPSDVTPYQVTETVVLTTEYIKLPDGDNTYTIPAGYAQFGPVYFHAKFVNKLTRAYNIQYNYMIYKDGEFLEYLYQNPNTFTDFGPGHYFPYPDQTGFYLPNWDGDFGISFKTPGTYKIVPVSREQGSEEWHQNIGSDTYFLTGVVSSDMKLTMYVGDGPGSDPTPEVTQADLDELAALYADQKTAINDKIAALTANDTKLDAIAKTLDEKKTGIDAAAAKIKTLKDKLTSQYLTAMQQSSYSTDLVVIEARLRTLQSEYDTAQKDLAALQTKSAALATTLNTLLATVNTESAAVASITTKAALDASKTKAADIKDQQTDCNVSAETTKVNTLETTALALSVADIETSLASMDSKVEADIAAAKKAEDDAKDKEAKEKELAEAKKELTENYDNLAKLVNTKLDVLAEYKKTIANLEAAVKDAQAAIDPVEKKVTEIKESLKSDMLTAEQKASFQTQLDALAKAKEDYAAALKTHQDRLDVVEKDVNDTEAVLLKLKDEITTQKDKVTALTIDDDLTAVKATYQSIETLEKAASPATDVEKDLAAIKEDLDKLSLESTSKDLAALETEVDKAIAGGQEEFEKQQAEKLAKAKGECQSAIDQLDALIKDHQASYDKLANAQEDLKAKLKELEEVIAKLKTQYTDIEKMLDELIAKQTRAEDDPIAKLQEGLKKLADNIAILEKQRQQIADQIGVLDTEMQQYAAVIETVKETMSQLQNSLASATAIADVESLTASVTKASNTLKSDGVDAYNLYVENYGKVIDNINVLIDNVNSVDNQADTLETAVQKETTSIQRVTVDESEVQGRYDMKGNPVDSTYKGIQIIRLKNGRTIKLNVK